eukprot:c45771_g1_i1.p1 GENE.c45771_g1_i1~~c45771_g1_i1.p1  ORF type:complete len:349 (+),score=30.62 c45771_g1_i1:33-1079(+)
MARPLVVDGLRLVPRVVRSLEVFTKQRWFGKTVVEAISSDFPAYSSEYCIAAVGRGTLGVKQAGVRVSNALEHRLDDRSIVLHTLHQHEPPVLNLPSPIIYEDDDCIAVSKAPCMPVHATSSYFVNTVLHCLIEARPDLAGAQPVHRLDRLTSGVLVLSKSAKSSPTLYTAFRDRSVTKRYMARVKGQFGGPNAAPGTIVECNEPISRWYVDSMVRYGVRAGGKESRSMFRLVSYRESDQTSLVEAQPITGRTHQLRLHLAHLGHPIVGDPIYAESLVRDMRTSSVRAAIACMGIEPHCPHCRSESLEMRYAGAVQAAIMLHAAHIELSLPDGRYLSLSSPLPEWASE